MKKSIELLTIAALLAAFFTGCKDDPVLPAAGFNYEPAEVTQYDEVAFTNTTTGATSYAWDFGDGAFSTDMSPAHMFTTAGSFTVTMVATNEDGDAESSQTIDVVAPVNTYVIDDTTYTIDSTMFWYQSGMGGDPYIRLLTAIDGQDNPELLKLYPSMGVGDLPGTYTWNSEKPEGTYDVGYTSGYAGMAYDWTAIGKTGSDDLVITELEEGVYRFEGQMVLSLGAWDYGSGEFIESGTASLTLEYVGGVTPL